MAPHFRLALRSPRRHAWLASSLAMLLGLAAVPVAGCGGGDEPTCDDTIDDDSDGLGNCSEASAGTDPANGDTDGDGLLDGEEAAHGSDPLVADTDGDGLTDGDEVARGSNPAVVDTDGDGLSDFDEVQCVSNPTDAEERCYACGWAHRDPGTLVSQGSANGDTVANLKAIDQCGEEVDLWDFAGQYHILFMTAAW